MNTSRICVVVFVVFTILLTGCGKPNLIQPTVVAVTTSNTLALTNTPMPTNTPIPTSTSTPVPTKTSIPTNTSIPSETPTLTPTPRIWTYEQRQLFWSQSGAILILLMDNPPPDPLIPEGKNLSSSEELWAMEIPADYLCEWLYTQIISGVAFPDDENRQRVWESSAHWLGYVDKEPYCIQFDLVIGFNP